MVRATLRRRGRLTHAPPDRRPHLLRLLADLEAGRVPPARPPWARPGWGVETQRWIADVLAGQGITPAAVSAFKLWGISAVLRIETDSGDFWFKTTNRQMPLFVNEAAFTGKLAGIFPETVPTPVAVRTETDWMLLEAFDETFQWPIPTETLCAVFETFARLQIASIPHVNELFTAGAIDRRLHVLRTQVPEMLADPAATERLSESDRTEILAMEAAFLDLIDRLTAQEVPMTLVHGDLHPGNAAVHNGQVIVFDWTDASIAHPFFDMMAISWFEEQADAVRQAYLNPWRSVLPDQDLEAVAELAMVVLQLHHAYSYLMIVRHLEPDSKIELNMTHEFLLEARDRAKAYLEKHPTSNGST